MKEEKTKGKNTTNIPEYEIEALARCLLPAIEKFFSSQEGKQEFAKWKKQQQENK